MSSVPVATIFASSNCPIALGVLARMPDHDTQNVRFEFNEPLPTVESPYEAECVLVHKDKRIPVKIVVAPTPPKQNDATKSFFHLAQSDEYSERMFKIEESRMPKGWKFVLYKKRAVKDEGKVLARTVLGEIAWRIAKAAS